MRGDPADINNACISFLFLILINNRYLTFIVHHSKQQVFHRSSVHFDAYDIYIVRKCGVSCTLHVVSTTSFSFLNFITRQSFKGCFNLSYLFVSDFITILPKHSGFACISVQNINHQHQFVIMIMCI